MQLILGVRCSSSEYSYAALKGSKQKPEILASGRVAFPRSFAQPQRLKWLLQEISTILEKHKISEVSIKVTEGIASRGKSFVIRVENEAIVQLAAATKGIKPVYKKVYCTIAKNLGLKGKAKCLATDLDYSVFPNFDKMHVSIQDAILVAWSSLYDNR